MSGLCLNTGAELAYFSRLKNEEFYSNSEACDIILLIRQEYENNMDEYPLKDDPIALGFFDEDAD